MRLRDANLEQRKGSEGEPRIHTRQLVSSCCRTLRRLR